jgi:hypothetical protein
LNIIFKDEKTIETGQEAVLKIRNIYTRTVKQYFMTEKKNMCSSQRIAKDMGDMLEENYSNKDKFPRFDTEIFVGNFGMEGEGSSTEKYSSDSKTFSF